MENNAPKEIKIVSGDGSELNISDVEKHLDIQKPKQKDKIITKNISPFKG